MGRSIFQQETQVRSSDVYDDTVALSEANMETNPVNLLEDLNNLRSVARRHLAAAATNWFDDLLTPSTLETGTQRGINDVNDALHLIEKKRFLRKDVQLVDVTVAGGQNFQILGGGELPANTTIAVGVVTTLGTVAADHNAAFGAHSLLEVAGETAINPQNLVDVVDGATRDPILSSGRVVRALLQSENASDGFTATGTTPNRLQVSFVRINATGDDLEAVPVADIENQVVNLCFRERRRFEDLTQQAFLNDAKVDVPAGSTVTRQVAYDNQGTTPVDLTTNATLDIETPGGIWQIRDDLEAPLFQVIEGSAGGTSQVNVNADVDEFDVDAVVNNFANGVSMNTGGTRPIDVGVTDGVIESTAGDLEVQAAAELLFDDGNRGGSGFSVPLKMTEDSSEWDQLESTFGEVSLASMLLQGGHRRRVFAVVTSNENTDVDLSGPSNDNNLDTDLGDLSGGVFTDDYDFYYNGQYLRPGANAAANHDIYPGTSLANGQIRLEFKAKSGDQIAVIDRVSSV